MDTLKGLFSKKDLGTLETRKISLVLNVINKNYGLKESAYSVIDNYVSLISQDGGENWLKSQKKRLLDNNNEADSVLSEIRSYAEILIAKIDIRPIYPNNKEPTPDFIIKSTKNIYVDVAYKNQNKDSCHVIDEISNEIVSTKITEITPFGKTDPKKINDSPTTNMISKIASIKQKEHQFTNDINILWLDLRAFSEWPDILKAHHFTETHMDNGKRWSGGIWHAFYGHKGKKIFEEDKYNPANVIMEHDGRFVAGSKSALDGAFICVPNCTVFFTNKNRANLPRSFLTAVKNIPYFNKELSQL